MQIMEEIRKKMCLNQSLFGSGEVVKSSAVDRIGSVVEGP